MKRFITILTLALLLLPMNLINAAEGGSQSQVAAEGVSLSQRADSAYTADNFALAEQLYQQAAAEEGTSSTLFYNLGNTYYRQGQLGRAILYYERALKLDPANEDARTNLAFVNSKIIDEPGDRGSVMTKLMDKTVAQARSNTWSWLALGAFTLLLVGALTYVFASNVALRKLSFFGGLCMLGVTIAFVILALVGARKAESTTSAIIVAPSTQLSTSPRVPKDKSEQAILLHEGTRVEILDSVATPGDSLNPMWLDVSVDNTHRAWISATDVERI